jgi:hypothetical protein
MGTRFKGFWSVLLLNAFPFSRHVHVKRSFEYMGELIDRGWNVLGWPAEVARQPVPLQPGQEHARKQKAMGGRAIGHRVEGAGRGRIWVGLVPAMLLPAVSSVLYFHLFPQARISWLLYTGTKIFTIIWPVVAILAIEGHRPRLGPVDWRKHAGALPLGLLTGAAIGGLGIALYHFTGMGAYIDAHGGAIQAKVRALHLLEYYFLYVTFLSILHSLIEEYFWRWYVFGRLARVVPAGAAYALASLAFAAHHYVVLAAYFPAFGTIFFGTCVAIGGALWCALFRRQETLAGAWVSHMLVDMAIFYIGYRILFAA